MNNSEEVRRLADSIAGLVNTITEIISAEVKTAIKNNTPQAQPQAPAQNPAPQMQACDPILSKRQLSAHFQVSLRTINNWMKRKYLSYYKIGKMVRFRLSDIQSDWDAKLKLHSYESRSGSEVLTPVFRRGSVLVVRQHYTHEDYIPLHDSRQAGFRSFESASQWDGFYDYCQSKTRRAA